MKPSRDGAYASAGGGFASSPGFAPLDGTGKILIGQYGEENGIFAPFYTRGASFRAPYYGRPGPPHTFRSVQTYLDVAKALAAGKDDSFIDPLLTLQPAASARATAVANMPMDGPALASYHRAEFDVHLTAFRARLSVDQELKAQLLATADRPIANKYHRGRQPDHLGAALMSLRDELKRSSA